MKTPPHENAPVLCTLSEASKMLERTSRQVKAMVKRRELNAVNIRTNQNSVRNQLRITRASIERFLTDPARRMA